ncbi:phage scaffolding protein [[Clostridium] scindens]|uniref:phage scaffolding protein n=1 Tax=Clostridium scindens (strain JCM 10418 / VPI 12708) TaxID=29347 RepID=UPI00209724F4|nr:phage scaffolding protein [[Clostridium] scindens]MCO7174298.1 phage scaffolding protein [[Clostridium] scindens]
MEWLKKILSNAVYGEDGELDVEKTLEKINKEAPNHIIPKVEYDTKVTELNTANATIKDLQESTEGNEELQGKIETYETEIKNLQKANEDMQKSYRLKEVISNAGCTDADYLIYKHGGLDKFTFDKDGKPVGVDEIVKSYKESTPMLFHTGQKHQSYNPPGGKGAATTNPFAKETFNLTEQGRMLKENPAQAQEMAAAAGVTL